LVLGTAFGGGAANAAYLLNTSGAFGSGSFGQVTVTGTSSDLIFTVQLFDDNKTISAGHFALAGELSGTITGLGTSGNSADFTLTTGPAGTLANDPFKGFDFGLTCTACGGGASNPYALQTWSVDIKGTNLAVQNADSFNGENITFSADIYDADWTGSGGKTGAVGGGNGGVPEPATWGLMIAGFGAIGAAMRQRRRAFTAA
jgi:hypothetical protein